MTICQADSGSMYGNVPICRRTATHAVTYRFGHYGELVSLMCTEHLRYELGRIYPATGTVTRLSG